MPPEGGDGSEYDPWSQQQSTDYLQDLLARARTALDWDENLVRPHDSRPANATTTVDCVRRAR